MRNRVLVLLGLLVGSLPLAALASEPGSPMDCTDLELAPGLTCTQLTGIGEERHRRTNDAVVDNDGHILEVASVRNRPIEILGPCGAGRLIRSGLVYQVDGAAQTPILSVARRCFDQASSSMEEMHTVGIYFDAVRGSLFVTMRNSCFSVGGGGGTVCEGFVGGDWDARIDGFTPLAAVLPSPPPLCDNGLDDDGDGAVDLDDRDCKSAADNDESRP